MEAGNKLAVTMYLNGDAYLHSYDEKGQPIEKPTFDGKEIKSYIVELGYWRKHPNLHGFIVQTFANGVDECQTIELGKAEMEKIIKAICSKRLPHTEGFFFGVSDGSEDEESIRIFEDAIKWLETKDGKTWRSVTYRASW